MRMSRRMGLFGGGKLPTFVQLFSTINSQSSGGANSPSASTRVKSAPSISTGSPWYYFFFVGSSLEIARIDLGGDGKYRKTQLSLTASSGAEQTFSLNESTGLASSNNELYGCFYLCLHFDSTYSPAVIDRMMRNGLKDWPKYYYSSTEGSYTNLRVAKSLVADYTGACLAAFSGSSTSILDVSEDYTNSDNWSISDWSDPLTPIVAYQGNSTLNRTVIRQASAGIYPDGPLYVYTPTVNGTSATCYTHNYSLFRLYEDW